MGWKGETWEGKVGRIVKRRIRTKIGEVKRAKVEEKVINESQGEEEMT